MHLVTPCAHYLKPTNETIIHQTDTTRYRYTSETFRDSSGGAIYAGNRIRGLPSAGSIRHPSLYRIPHGFALLSRDAGCVKLRLKIVVCRRREWARANAFGGAVSALPAPPGLGMERVRVGLAITSVLVHLESTNTERLMLKLSQFIFLLLSTATVFGSMTYSIDPAKGEDFGKLNTIKLAAGD